MKAAVGDRIIIRGRTVEATDRHGEIIEVRGENGGAPYLIRFDDGHESVVFPGGDSVLESQA